MISNLREALESRLETLPMMSHSNGYPVQALPKTELLDLLAMYPADPPASPRFCTKTPGCRLADGHDNTACARS